MKYTIDVLKKVVSVSEPTNLSALVEHLRKMYGDEWVNIKIVSQDGSVYHNDINNYYYGNEDQGWVEPGIN